jgi:hypothetical protein
VIIAPEVGAWAAYFGRALGPASVTPEAYERLRKDGPGGGSWHEYILEAYVNFTPGAVFLRGLPDVPESRPHAGGSTAR